MRTVSHDVAFPRFSQRGGRKIAISAKDTRKALKRHVLPGLREAGFTDGTPSKLWRHHEGRIEVICLSTYSTYRALTDNCTTASFTVRLGISLNEYSVLNSHFQKDYVKDGPNGPRPDEPQMPIRGVLCPRTAPPLTKGRWEREYQPMWRVETVEDAEARAEDLAIQLRDYGLDWLTRGWDMDDIMVRLERDEMNPLLISAENGSHMWLDAGGKGSHVRADHLMMARRGSGKRRLPG
jgi:hypothetical protein